MDKTNLEERLKSTETYLVAARTLEPIVTAPKEDVKLLKNTIKNLETTYCTIDNLIKFDAESKKYDEEKRKLKEEYIENNLEKFGGDRKRAEEEYNKPLECDKTDVYASRIVSVISYFLGAATWSFSRKRSAEFFEAGRDLKKLSKKYAELIALNEQTQKNRKEYLRKLHENEVEETKIFYNLKKSGLSDDVANSLLERPELLSYKVIDHLKEKHAYWL